MIITKIKTYFIETRPHFLILTFALIFLGASMSWYSGYFNLGYLILAFFGLLFLHISTNVLNDYYDYRNGIDLNTERTPFSGGSGILISGQLSARETFWMGTISFILAVPIGAYFVFIKGWEILPIFIIGSIFVLFYTSHLTKVGTGVSEISAGLGLGTLPVLGVYIILNQGYSLPAVYASIPSGILVCNLLFLNEFPDVDADKKGGRKSLPIIMGKDKAAVLYSILISIVYIWIILGSVLGIMPSFTLIALFTLPFAVKAIKGSIAHSNKEKLIPALAANVMVVLGTQFLMGVGYILAKLI